MGFRKEKIRPVPSPVDDRSSGCEYASICLLRDPNRILYLNNWLHWRAAGSG